MRQTPAPPGSRASRSPAPVLAGVSRPVPAPSFAAPWVAEPGRSRVPLPPADVGQQGYSCPPHRLPPRDGDRYPLTTGKPELKGTPGVAIGLTQLTGKAPPPGLGLHRCPDPQLCGLGWGGLDSVAFCLLLLKPGVMKRHSGRGSAWGPGQNCAQAQTAPGWGGGREFSRPDGFHSQAPHYHFADQVTEVSEA